MERAFTISPHRKLLRTQITKHPLLSYTILAYFISWIAWFCLYKSDLGLFSGLGMIGAMGPALAAMTIASIIDPMTTCAQAKSRRKIFGFLSLGFLTVLFLRRLWLTSDLTAISGRLVTDQVYSSIYLFLLDALAATAAAFIFSGFLSSNRGVHDLLCSLNVKSTKTHWYWLLIAFLGYPLIVLVGNTISSRLGIAGLTPKASGPWYLLILDVLLAFLVTMFGGGGLEEPGWRGFALPLLKKRTNSLTASLILAVIWAFWHWPMFWFGFYGGGALGVFSFLIGCVPIAVLFTFVFYSSKRSLLIVIVLHTSINITPTFLPVSPISSGLWWLLMLCAGLWMWKSPQSFSASNKSNTTAEIACSK